MTWPRLIALGVLVLVLALDARAQLLQEGFEAGTPPVGWASVNYSTYPQTSWFTGNTGVFAAQAGSAGSYAAANFLATVETGDVSVWLFTPALALAAGDTLTFYTRAELVPGVEFSDGLMVRIGPALSLDPVDFDAIVLELGPVLTADPYPTAWTEQTVVIPTLPNLASARIAFQYFAEGPEVASYVAIDSVTVSEPSVDSDGDGVPDASDNCPTVANLTQTDGGLGLEIPADGVGDACDNCVRVNNPSVAADFLSNNPWATLTGDQRDDDHDGYGNKCDAKFTGTPNQAVGGLDLGQFRGSAGKDRRLDTCGAVAGTRPCAIYDLDDASAGDVIGGLDFGRFRQLNGASPGPRCAACTGTGSVPLPCTAGTAGSCTAP